ncbi:MAG: ArsC family reductase [Pseudomonadales bacterium]|jgi:Spx/MgsR family transcriptional regulator|nr:ArsC family reductase [Pseudomonadales bacterium]
MALTLYGIPNCDTMKKARAFLEQHNIPYAFHDYKKASIDTATLERWSKTTGMQTLLNMRGTTWRKLDDAERANLTDAKALRLMQAQPSLIKRPVLEGEVKNQKLLLVGFDAPQWESLLLH